MLCFMLCYICFGPWPRARNGDTSLLVSTPRGQRHSDLCVLGQPSLQFQNSQSCIESLCLEKQKQVNEHTLTHKQNSVPGHWHYVSLGFSARSPMAETTTLSHSLHGMKSEASGVPSGDVPAHPVGLPHAVVGAGEEREEFSDFGLVTFVSLALRTMFNGCQHSNDRTSEW